MHEEHVLINYKHDYVLQGVLARCEQFYLGRVNVLQLEKGGDVYYLLTDQLSKDLFVAILIKLTKPYLLPIIDFWFNGFLFTHLHDSAL